MSVNFQKTIATSLIVGLVFPFLAEAQLSTQLNVGIQTDTLGTRPNVDIRAQEDSSPNTNFNNVAPVQQIRSGNTITTTVPTIDAAGPKEEGVWSFTVSRYGEIESDTFRHDLTPPKCPVSPTQSAYNNENDHYTNNNLINPWPVGLNGQWTNTIISFPNNSPTLCRDQITISGTTYSEKGYVAGQCNNPDGSPKFYHKDDLDDCLREQAGQQPNKTRSLSQMAGCKYTDEVSINQNDTATDFVLYDKVDNFTNTPANPICLTPVAMIDKEAPEIPTFQVEHIGLGLPQENLRTTQANPNTYRADAGELILHVNIQDVDATTNSGMSGVNWEPLVFNPAIDQLRYDIANAENLLNNQTQDLVTAEADIILYRSEILEKLSILQRNIITNNLLHKVSNEVNNSSNFFMQALVSLTPGVTRINNAAASTSLMQDVQNLIERSKFDDIDDIDDIRNLIEDFSLSAINSKITTYSRDLPALLNRASISEAGEEIDVTNTNNSFNEYYNQWQIDKAKNYSSVFPTWVQDLNALNRRVDSLKTDYENINTSYESSDTLVLLQELADIAPSSILFSLMLTTETTASEHLVSQNDTVNSLQNVESVLQNSKSYLQNFNPNTDNFDNSKVSQIATSINPASNALGSLIRDLSDNENTGSLAHSMYGISAIENSDEINQLMEAEKSNIRRLNTEIQQVVAELEQEEDNRDLIETTIKTQREAIVVMKKDLADMVSQDASNDSAATSLSQQKITHLRIKRLTAPAKTEEFFPPTTTPISGSKYEWDLNSFKFATESTPLFTKTGTYEISAMVYDKAGNETIKTGYIQILPGSLVVDAQSNCNIASGIPYADNSETCNISMPQVDNFGNRIQNRDLKLSVRDQNINGSYNLIEGLGSNYQNGIRFNGGSNSGNKNILTWRPTNTPLKTVLIRSLLPTVTVLPYEPDSDYGVGYALTDGVELPLILEHPNIGPRGNPIAPMNQTNLELPVQFKPWINVKVKGGMGTFNNRSWRPEVAKPFEVYVDAGTLSSRKLPPNFRVNVAAFIGPSYEFNDADLSKPGVNVDFAGVDTAYIESTGNAGKPAPLTTTINSVSALSGQQSSSALFIPTTTYNIGPRIITVPGLPAGSCPGGTSESCFTETPPPRNAVDLTISNASANEPGTLSFNFGLSDAYEEDVRIYLKANDNNATVGQDYTFEPTRFVDIKAGELGATYNITVNDDDEVEDTETFVLSVDTFEPAEALNDFSDTGLGSINDLDNGITNNNGVVTEGAICLMDVRLERPTDEDVVISATLGGSGDTATAGADYVSTNVSTTILAGESAAFIEVQTNEDNIREGIENFTVTIDSVTGGSLSDIRSVATCEIADNDREPNAYLLNTNVREGDRAQITVVLGEQNMSGLTDNEDVTLRLQTFDLGNGENSAIENLDYQPRTFDVEIPAGTKRVTAELSDAITTLNDDEIEADESFGVRIIGVMQGKIGSINSRANVLIEDASNAPKPSISMISSEDGVEKTPEDTIEFDVVLDYPNESGSDIIIVLETEDITASGGTDYTPGDLTVTIPNGAISGKSTPVIINDDITPENNETFRVKFKSSTPSNALLNSTPEGIGTIYDNDAVATDITIDDASACESANCQNGANGSIIFELNLSKPHVDDGNGPLEVTYRRTPLTATAGDDYVAGEYKAIFNVGQQKAFLEAIPLINDADPETAETFEVSFVRVESGHTLGNTIDTAIGTITDSQNAVAPSVIISDTSGVEGGRAVFNVSLDSPAQGRLEIEMAPSNIGTESNDYTCPTDMRIIFADGQMNSQIMACDINLDAINEPSETFEVLVTNTIGTVNDTNDKGTATINNLQTLDVVLKEPSIIMESDTAGQIEFTLSLEDNGAPLDQDTSLEKPMNLTISPEDILAIGGTNLTIAGIDYRAGDINVTLEPGKGESSTYAKIGVAIANDSIVEVARPTLLYPENMQENFNLALSASNENIRSLTDVEGIIQDDDYNSCSDQAKVKIVDAQAVEGDRMEFDISLDRTLCDEAVTLNFETIDGGAIDGLDYTGGNYSVTIPARSRRPVTRLSIPTTQDTFFEGNENFRLNYVNSTPNGLIDRVERHSIRNDNSHQNRGTVPIIATIIDNDELDITAPEMTVEDASATEGDNLNFVVKLSKAAPEDTVIRMRAERLNPNPADPGLDFTTGSGTPVIAVVSILAGQGAGIARVSTVDDNVPNEGNENLLLRYLELNSGFLSNTSDTGNGIIYDNDNVVLKPDVIITDGSAEEGSPITFTLKLENALGEAMVAPIGGIDFTIATGVLVGSDTAEAAEFGTGKEVRIAEGTSQRDFTIDTTDDTADENDEIFGLRITASNKASFVNDLLATSVGTIVDNDGPEGDTCTLYGINCPEETAAEPGAAIEGQIIADEIACVDGGCDSTDDDSIVLGTSTLATDIREEITRNAYELIRGRTPDNATSSTVPLNDSNNPIIERNNFTNNGNNYPRWDIYVDDLPDGGVTYLNGDINNDGRITGDEGRAYFRIGLRRDGNVGTLANPAIVNGKHTFVIINASVNVIGDMQYAGNDDSLGIIVLNDNVSNLQNMSRRGQLTVYKNVKHIVGALFTDGSLVSNVWIDAGAGGGRITSGSNANPNDDWDIINGYDSNGNQLGRQLILSGNILSKNTIGKADKAPPEGPWGEDLTGADGILKAQMYDFNYMRRYVPVYDGTGAQTNTNLCSNLPGQSGCYDNSKSFVIRVDPRLRENAPPGFTADGIINFR